MDINPGDPETKLFLLQTSDKILADKLEFPGFFRCNKVNGSAGLKTLFDDYVFIVHLSEYDNLPCLVFLEYVRDTVGPCLHTFSGNKDDVIIRC